jgi:hypothetical protein
MRRRAAQRVRPGAHAADNGSKMTYRFTLWMAGLCLVMAGGADAAPAKRRPARRPAPKVAPKPVVAKPILPITPGIMVPKPVVLTKPTPIEARAHAVWMLRAALNVAALQCQYSPFLRTVDNYNQMLRKHGAELTAAQATMVRHFNRTMKRGGAASFDRYNTRSYNSFSTLDAQYNFCWAAGQAGGTLRVANVGSMASVAEAMVPALRAALQYVPPAAGLLVPPQPPFPEVRIADSLAMEATADQE